MSIFPNLIFYKWELKARATILKVKITIGKSYVGAGVGVGSNKILYMYMEGNIDIASDIQDISYYIRFYLQGVAESSHIYEKNHRVDDCVQRFQK